MKIRLGLPERPFRAIQKGTKKAEGRVQTPSSEADFSLLEEGDLILFTNEDKLEKMEVSVTFVHHYPDPRAMLEAEGIGMLSSGSSLEQGVKNYNSFQGYAENIPSNGIYAIGVQPKQIIKN